MSRYGRNESYGHHVRRVGTDMFVISWTVDRYYTGSRLRHPVNTERLTNYEGAKRFARKHGLDAPKEPDHA